jgi:amino acid transporter
MSSEATQVRSEAAQVRSPGRLRRDAVGVPGVVFFVVAAAAPLAAMVGAAPVAIGAGDGAGTPGAYALAAIVLLLFAVGFAAMSRHMTNAGAFYAYIAHGLGRPLGLGAAYLAILAYNAIQLGLYGLLGFFAHDVLKTKLGIDLPWQAWVFLAVALVLALGWRQINLSARVLGTLMICEVIALLILDVAIVLSGGEHGLSATPFGPSTIFNGAAGVAFMFAFASFVGFEATAIYGEESREPRRTVPIATYVAVTGIGLFYVLTTWSVVNGYGVDAAGAAAAKDPGGFVFAAAGQWVGGWLADVMEYLVITSIFATVLAFHNAICRYLYALGREGLLPRALGRTHDAHESPHVASVVQTAIAVVVIGAFAIAGKDPFNDLFAWMTGLGTLGILTLQAGCALAVIGFFRRTRLDRRPWSTLIAPALGTAGLVAAVVLVVRNWDVLTGIQSGVLQYMPLLVPLAALAGIGVALWMRGRATGEYERLEVALDARADPLPAAVVE